MTRSAAVIGAGGGPAFAQEKSGEKPDELRLRPAGPDGLVTARGQAMTALRDGPASLDGLDDTPCQPFGLLGDDVRGG